MPFIVDWLDEDQTLLLIKLDGHISRDELCDAHDNANALLRKAAHPADLIFDPRHQVFYPPGLGETIRELHQIELRHLRSVVFIGQTLAWELFTHYVRRHGGFSYAIAWAEAMEDALAIIHRVRSGKFAPVLRPGSPDWN